MKGKKVLSFDQQVCFVICFFISYIPTLLAFVASTNQMIEWDFPFHDQSVSTEWFIYDLTLLFDTLLLRVFCFLLFWLAISDKIIKILFVVFIMDTLYDILNYILSYQQLPTTPMNFIIFIAFSYSIIKIIKRYYVQVFDEIF